MSSRTPETLTAAQRAQRLKLKPLTPPSIDLAPQPVNEQEPMIATKPPSKQEQKTIEQARKSLPSIGGGRTSATANIDPREDADMSFAMLPITEIERYGHNPRTSVNARYEEIKASIRADGITNTLTVTRRPNSTRYTPYGGGNTRLQIAKELYAEGDQRFATLKVIIKKWPGDAQTIAAHLIENELRADISFWEKASGVHQFGLELAQELGKPLTAGDLNRELRARGLVYGVKLIQNFTFAIEHLAPVGPWLKPTSVNELLRPRIGQLLELADKLGGRVGQLKTALHQVMQSHQQTLQARVKDNEDLDPHDRVAVELDDQALLQDMDAAAAEVFAVTGAKLSAMLALISSDSKVSADALRGASELAVIATTREPAFVATTSATPAERSDTRLSIGELTGSQSGTAPVMQPLAQTPLPGMLAKVPRHEAPVLPVAPEAPASRAPGPSKDAQTTIKEHLAEINNIVPLYDVLFSVPEMPFGYLIDLPEQDIAHAGNPQVTPVAPHLIPLRHAIWKLLAILSYQFDARCMNAIPPQNAREMHWTTAYQQGKSAFEQACAARAGFYLQGDAFAMGTTEFQLVLATPALGYSFIKLLGAMEQLRLDQPDRFPVGFEPMFPTTQ